MIPLAPIMHAEKKGTTVKKGHQGSAYYVESILNTMMFQLLLWCMEEDSECHSILAASKSSKLQPAGWCKGFLWWQLIA